MTFHEELNQYITQIGCTAKELSDVSGISAATLSRYRAGARIPGADSEQLAKLAGGIVVLAHEKGLEELTAENILQGLQSTLSENTFEHDRITANFNTLVTVLNINVTELARSMNFDASYLSRIRAGQRKPADMQGFVEGVCRFVVRHYTCSEDKAVVADLIGDKADSLADDAGYMEAVKSWLCGGMFETKDYMSDFLKKMDDFNLDEYIKAIHFDELKVPSVPFQRPASRQYYGIEQMRQGELDFFKATVLSKSREPVFMCSDMPMADMAEDMDFNRKWMFAIAMTLKKGLHLNIIHNLDRPFHEMMLGLESWIPIYMTGQVSPYHLKGVETRVYHHFNYTSGTVALTGECINGYHGDGKYYLTNHKEEVAYYKKKTANLLSKAQPLMEIHRSDTENIYNAFLTADAKEEGIRHNILSSLPIYTMPEDMLEGILKRHAVAEADIERLLVFARRQKELTNQILSSSPILDEVVEVTSEEFQQYPMVLSLSGAFYEKEITCTYEEYVKHLQLTREFSERHSNYTVRVNYSQVFRNIQIAIHEGKWVMVSKNKTPVVHFIIRHPKMVHALENFIAPVIE